VLTANSLNGLQEYLDTGNRLTRTRLIGTGIAFGQEVRFAKNDAGVIDTLIISAGTSVTTNGELINFEEDYAFKYYQSFTDQGSYSPFLDQSNPGEAPMQIPIYKLYQDDNEGNATALFSTDSTSFLHNKVVMLYVEEYTVLGKKCFTESCDEKESNRIFNLHALLIDKSYVQTRFNVPNIAGLPALRLGIPVFTDALGNLNPLNDYADLHLPYGNAAAEAVSGMATALKHSYKDYSFALEDLYPENEYPRGGMTTEWTPFHIDGLTPTETLQNRINQTQMDMAASPPVQPHTVQLLYQHFNDLVHAYEEYREVAPFLIADQSLEDYRHDRHVLLGLVEVSGSGTTKTYTINNEFRHPWRPEGYREDFNESILLAKSMHQRLVHMFLDYIGLQGTMTYQAGLDSIKDFPVVTPGANYQGRLGQRPLPAYYQPDILAGFWNPESEDGKVLSYYGDAQGQTNTYLTQEVLPFNAHKYQYYQIEGHLDQSLQQVEANLLYLQRRFSLPFKVLSVVLKPNEPETVDLKNGFADLQEEYWVHTRNMKDLIANLRAIYDIFLNSSNPPFDVGLVSTTETSSPPTSPPADTDDASAPDKTGDNALVNTINDVFNYLDNMANTLPNCLDAFDMQAFQNAYRLAIQSVVDFLLQEFDLLGSLMSSISGSLNAGNLQSGQDLLNQVIRLASRVLDHFFYLKLSRLYYGFVRRKMSAALYDPGSLFGLMHLYPGLISRNGVEAGGSLVLVYEESTDDLGNTVKTVVADFAASFDVNQKYLDVTFCDDDESIRQMPIPPFARPDVAVTRINEETNIKITANDPTIFPMQVQLHNEYPITTEKGGIVEATTDDAANSLTYTPPADFIGYDSFFYQIINTQNGMKDTAKVSVYVWDGLQAKDFDLLATQGEVKEVKLSEILPDTDLTGVTPELYFFNEFGSEQVTNRVVLDSDPFTGEATTYLEVATIDGDIGFRYFSLYYRRFYPEFFSYALVKNGRTSARADLRVTVEEKNILFSGSLEGENRLVATPGQFVNILPLTAPGSNVINPRRAYLQFTPDNFDNPAPEYSFLRPDNTLPNINTVLGGSVQSIYYNTDEGPAFGYIAPNRSGTDYFYYRFVEGDNQYAVNIGRIEIEIRVDLDARPDDQFSTSLGNQLSISAADLLSNDQYDPNMDYTISFGPTEAATQ